MHLIAFLIEEENMKELREILNDNKSSNITIINAALNLLILILTKQITI
jgi:hypothetical protein